MPYLVLSDIHANLEALTAVLQAAPPVDGVIYLGDLVGYGPDPCTCVGTIRALPNVVCLAGNHDLVAIGLLRLGAFSTLARRAAEWTAKQIDTRTVEYLQSLPTAREYQGSYLAHASPRDPVWEYMEETSQGPPNFALFEQAVCFVGHTHVPRVFYQAGPRLTVTQPGDGEVLEVASGARAIINPGGVGQPRDGDPRAAYGMWEPEYRRFTFYRVEYAIEQTQAKILAAGLPQQLANRLSVGL